MIHGYWRQRAIAHGRLGEVGAATLAHGEAALRRGRLKEAHDLATRARRQLTVGTPEHLRALDIENAARNQLGNPLVAAWGDRPMTRSRPVFARLFSWLRTCLMALGLGLAAAPAAADLSEADTDQLRAMVRAYLLENPKSSSRPWKSTKPARKSYRRPLRAPT